MSYGASDHSSSFRGELPERGRGDSAGVSTTPSSQETTALAHERVTSPGCNHRRRKVRRDHALSIISKRGERCLAPFPSFIPVT